MYFVHYLGEQLSPGAKVIEGGEQWGRTELCPRIPEGGQHSKR